MPNEYYKDVLPRQFCFTTTNQPTDSYQVHCHSFHEIYYFVEGDADYLVEGKEYRLTPNSLILLSPHTLHGVRVNSAADYVRCAIHFEVAAVPPEHRQILLSPFPGNKKNSPKEVFYEHTDHYELITFFRQFVDSQKQPEPLCSQYYPIYLQGLLAQISLISQSLRPTTITSNVSDTITDIIHYVNEHLAAPLSLDLLSARFFISKYYLNRAFKKATGTTVMDYVIYKRVIMARQLILNGHTASDAAIRSGFGDYSSFYRSYRKIMGQSPRNGQKAP